MRASLSVYLLLGLLFASCDATSPIGSPLTGDSGGVPQSLDAAITLQPTTSPARAGALVRAIAGSVTDPIAGSFQATGFVDVGVPFAQVGSSLDEFRAATTREVQLVLKRDYVYGDTLSPITLELHEIASEIDDRELNTQSAISVREGAALSRVTISPMDTLVTLPLPASWVAERDTTLRSLRVASLFHGFRITATAGQAAVGFNRGLSYLLAIADSDTVRFPVTVTATTTQRTVAPNLPAGRVLLQAGFPTTHKLNFRIQDYPALVGASLNRVYAVLPIDTVAMNAPLPPNFVRPSAPVIEFAAFEGTLDAVTLTQTAAFSEGGGLLRNLVQFGAPQLLTQLQRRLLNQTTAELSFFVRPAQESGTLNPLIVHDGSSSTPSRFILLYVAN